MPDQYSGIRSLPLAALAGALGFDFTKFRKRSNGELYGPCPLHDPSKNVTSFSYSADGRFHCFSCEAKGSGAIDLTKLVKGLGFKDAVSFLEPLIAVQAAQQSANKKSPVQGENITSGELKPFVGQYQKYAVENEWLNARCPDKAVREGYGVFFYSNPKRNSQVNNHVLIPIRDIEGVNFGYLARNIGEVTAERPKYRLPANLPKSKFLFGAAEIKASQPLPVRVVYVVESWLSVLHFASLGFQAVSLYGWSLADEQVSILQTLAKGIVYLPDRNKYEQSASGIARIAASLWLRFPPLPGDCQDPEHLTKEQVLAL